jgi:hypothetical protein
MPQENRFAPTALNPLPTAVLAVSRQKLASPSLELNP